MFEKYYNCLAFGRLIAWGSNNFHQLGRSSDNAILQPLEIVLDSPIQQCTCGPESTLVLTQKGSLYLTGRLNEFVFPHFTELQKNLSSNEQIIFMNISKASEIFIVTNTGSIYRSYESVRNKSLIFQRFYDYDSEENGPIWKLMKGTSFYAVLTKAYKFYTTFSESGHHLKTFREISKFRNLRILDMTLGDRHILVHGIPRSSIPTHATIGSESKNSFMVKSIVTATNTFGHTFNNMNNDQTISIDGTQHFSSKNSNVVKNAEQPHHQTQHSDFAIEDVGELEKESVDLNSDMSMKESEESIKSFETGNTVLNKISPTPSLKSHAGSTSSPKSEFENTAKTVKSLRPRTPFPENSPLSSPSSVMKKTPKRNLSYEAAISNDLLQHNSSIAVESLEHIPEHFGEKDSKLLTNILDDAPGLSVSMPTPPTDEDEELRLEISETTDPLDHTVTLNEIRFINNGIDVTANVKKTKSDASEDSLDVTEDEEADCHDIESKLAVRKQAVNLIEELEDRIDEKIGVDELMGKQNNEHLLAAKSKGDESKFSEAKSHVGNTATSADEKLNPKLTEEREALDTTANRAENSSQNVSDYTKKIAQSAKQSMENVGSSITTARDETQHAIKDMSNNVAKATENSKESASITIRKMAGDTKQAVESVASRISAEVQDTKHSLSSILQVKKNKVDVQKPIEQPIRQDDDVVIEVSSKASGGNNSNATQSNNTATSPQEDDERTTVSASSYHIISSSNPFESSDPFDPELDAMVQRGKQALREELQAASVAAENKTLRNIDSIEEEKTKFTKFLDKLKEKTKSLSCRNEKSIKIAEDQPPRYSVEDELAIETVNGPTNGSKVCTIL